MDVQQGLCHLLVKLVEVFDEIDDHARADSPTLNVVAFFRRERIC